MADTSTITVEQMNRATRIVERRMAPTYLGAMQAVRATLTLKEITSLLEAGNLQGATRSAGVAMSNWFNANWMPAYNTSASQAALFLQRGMGIPMSFDVTNWSAVNNIQQTRLQLVTGFTREQTRSSMAAIQEAFDTGLNPRATARAFRGSIGLTERQTRAVANYRRLLEEGNSDSLSRALRDKRFDRTVRRALQSKSPLPKEHIDRMVGRYNERMLKYRSEVIARTESLRSVNGGQKDMFDQAISEGSLQNDQLERTWNTANDERVRDSHSIMHSQTVKGTGEPFVSGLGNMLDYPCDPKAPAEDSVQCRCAVSTTLTKIVVPA